MPAARITITLPPELISEIDRRERNRSRFVLDAVRREIHRRRREELRRSLDHPHPESSELADAGLEEWGARGEAAGDVSLLDSSAGKSIRWVEGRGWVDRKK
jgi:hypothetical protein